MLSRVAENIYWIGRYLERAENMARLINVNANLMLDLPKNTDLGWEPLIHILGFQTGYFERHEEITERRVVNYLISDETNPGSILSTLSYARENARTIQDILPREAWEELNTFYQDSLETKQSSYARHGRNEYLNKIIRGVHQHVGLMAGTMNHNTAYKFLNLGRKIERADMTSRIINVKSENPLPDDIIELRPFNDVLWLSMLESLGAYQMYRKSMQSRINRVAVLTFLFRNAEFPRSLAYCIENINYNLFCLPNNEAALKSLINFEQLVNKESIIDLDHGVLHHFIDEIQIALAELHDAIASTYFPQISNSEERLAVCQS
jgi:uncharacterized alpha-E superfamily protein